MATILKGAPVVEALNQRLINQVAELNAQGITPKLAIVRVGEKESDISYERGATKRMEKVGVAVKQLTLSGDVEESSLLDVINGLNSDQTVHGVLLLRPLPRHIDEDKLRNTLSPEKDIDGITDLSLARVFTGGSLGFTPCTAQACIEILDYYGIDVAKKRAVVVGRSLVIGKPIAMMLLDRNATVTICHSQSSDLPAICSEADVVIACAGRARMLDASYLSAKQTVIDVGINITDDGALVGDVDFAAAEAVVGAITPVPGGVGSVTTSVLAKNVIAAAGRCRLQPVADSAASHS